MSLNVCGSGHEDIAYEGLDCPLCELMEDKDEALRLIEVAEEEIRDLKTQVKDLEEDLKFYSDKGPYGP